MPSIVRRHFVRRGTTTQWTTANPVLRLGEPGLDTTLSMLKVGDGVTAWNSLPAALAAPPRVFEFTASGNYTPSAGIDHAIVELWGPGGGAGGTPALASQAPNTTFAMSASGASGGYVRALLTAAQLGAGPIAITIGLGGAGGVAGAAGSNGSANSTFVAAGGSLLAQAAQGSPSGLAAILQNQSFSNIAAPQGGSFTVSVGVDIGSARGCQGSVPHFFLFPGTTNYQVSPPLLTPPAVLAKNDVPTWFVEPFMLTNPAAAPQSGTSAPNNSGAGGQGVCVTITGALSAQTGGSGGSGFCRVTEYFS